MKRTIGFFAIAVCCAAFVFVRCSNLATGNGSDVGNAGLTGRLVDGRNGAPAKGAVVRIYQVYLNKMAKALGKVVSGAPAIDSTYTDHNGAYRFDSLDQGIYSIDAQMVDGADTLAMRHPSVVFVASKDLGYDTLRLPGSIAGKVVVPGGESQKNITCYIPGTSYIAMTNDTGGFKITGIPAGTYSLSVASTKFNDTTLYSLTVKPGRETNTGTITLGLNRSKNEHDVWAVFDSSYDCRAIARIEARVSGDSIPADSPRVYSLDWRPSLNGFSGFIYVPDNGFFWAVDIWVFDTLGHRIGAYRIPVINRATGDIEVPSFNPFNAFPAIILRDTMVSIYDTIRFTPVISMLSDDSIVSLEWKIGDRGIFTKTGNKDTTIVISGDPGTFRCIFRVTDKFGNSVEHMSAALVVIDQPLLTIGNDTMVSVGSALTFSAHVRQQFGSVVSYTWICLGDTSWVDSGSNDAKSVTFDRRGEQRLVCKVRDDDGNEAVDTVRILAATEIGGILPLNTVLQESSSPYGIKQDLVVLEGGSLTIEPGTVLWINPGIKININGMLEAIGLSSKRIVFKVNSIDSTARFGDLLLGSATYKFINCNATNGRISMIESHMAHTIIMDSCIFIKTQIDVGGNPCRVRGCNFSGERIGFGHVYCIVDGNKFVTIDKDSPCDLSILNYGQIPSIITSNHFVGGGRISALGRGEIVNNIVENSMGDGISAFSQNGFWLIANNSVFNCAGTGIYVDNSYKMLQEKAIIRHNSVVGNGFGRPPTTSPNYNAGIKCLDSQYIIDSNVVRDNNIGVICLSKDTLAHNNIYNNRDFNFRVLISDTGSIVAPHTWWGTTDTSQIQAKIYDYHDIEGLGKLLIDPIASDSIPGAGAR